MVLNAVVAIRVELRPVAVDVGLRKLIHQDSRILEVN